MRFRDNQKLMFCLCRTCVLISNTGECCHTTVEETGLTGTWVIHEVRMAVQKWYRILEVYEVYEYVTRYDPETREGGMFASYMDTFLKLKAEASGYHGWVRSPVDDERNIQSFWKREGIRLDRGSIKFYAAKHGLAKPCLNSMCAKLTERNDRKRTKIITNPNEMYRFLATPGVEVTILAFANDDVVWLSWKRSAEERVPNLHHTN